VDKEWDSLVTKLMRAGFPLVDYHVHLKGGLTIEELVENSQKLGINYGVAPNCGLHFPVTDDESLNEYIESVKGSPTFKGMQAEGREWITLFSPEAVAKFDYVFTDAMTFTDAKGRRNRIWIPEEVWVDDKQQFMDQMVEKIEAIMSQEPVDIYVNPTVLPAQIMGEYNELWTKERMERVVKVLADNNIALEINARYKTPSAEMIKMAKEAGVKFSFGTNNTGRDLGRLEYCIQMIEECKLTPNDMFEIKPDHLKPVKVKGLPEKITG
jgi:N-acyl-D-aspartate/D-glutamate deacylase